jgi:hypothetical protein
MKVKVTFIVIDVSDNRESALFGLVVCSVKVVRQLERDFQNYPMTW